ncbi:MAG: bifunctional [glutamate--ammonia ligase]-adenylyl-L-tyrosine phosphorylase/[glutamate--ammonia-ligase] adenylyltransferase [Gammaproteobacteria bacterium]|nr:bifunctional [glutamate--ammonia ligase]-adenylyl-L-tyrosine phosphorylase/[glutamate--ammonia-ligase] adenylyltransferase [Gammaproteobacteria bacterium]
MKPDLNSLPEILHQPVNNWFERCGDNSALAGVIDANPELVADLTKVVACSPYVADVLERYPDMLPELIQSGRLARTLAGRDLLDEFLAAAGAADSDMGFERTLRLLRHRELARIVWRDTTHVAPCEETLTDLSAMADAAIGAAIERARIELEAKFGTPRTRDGQESTFVVLGMGKLGGRELNFSSDVDLIFVYSANGETDGARCRSNEEFFRTLAQRVVAFLSKKTPDGFVYRVDTRLRPFGDAGPLAVSVAALETYLAQHGRDWERYAYVKARVVNDWDEAESFYDHVLRPFVYRRYLDYGVFDSLRDMKSMIEAEVRRKELQNNVKLGRGGIREIEFIVQTLQLVRGGSVAELRERELMPALAKLVQPGGLPADVAENLREAYVFLRQFENRTQAINDRQTHDIPGDDVNRARLTVAMGYPDWQTLSEAVAEQRHVVSTNFHDIVLAGTHEQEAIEPSAKLIRAWAAGSADDSIAELLIELGYSDAAEPLEKLRAFRDSGFYLRLDEHGRQRLDTLMPAIVTLAGSESEPVDALTGALTIIEAIGRRSAYFALLNENPEALKRLVNLCAKSGFLVQQVATHPLLLDELLDPRIFLDAPNRESFAEDLEARLSAAPLDDAELRRDVLRNFQQAAVFRVAVADLSGTLPLMKVSDRLTDIAELVLGAALDLARFEMAERHGKPCYRVDGEDRAARFIIVAYGKLGGLELGYGSDLDIVFLHDSSGERQQTDGDKTLDNATYFVRLAQRIIHILTMSTSSGGLYEVDTRLRPNGKSGLLVSGIAAFERYQQEEAWTWEHQALLRGRAVAGDEQLRNRFERVRTSILTGHVHWDTLRRDVVDMRLKMRAELSKETPTMFDLKQGEGGVTDIEFMVQYLVLNEARTNADLVFYSDNIRQLEALAGAGILPADEAEKLAEVYRTYRRRIHRLALAGHPAVAPRVEVEDLPDVVRASWQRIFD